MSMAWTKIEDGLPTETGGYLTYSPGYDRGNAFTNREKCEGLVFSKFTISKNGNKCWSIEGNEGCMNYGVVRAWMPLPIPEWAHPYEDVPFDCTPGFPISKLEDQIKRQEAEKTS